MEEFKVDNRKNLIQFTLAMATLVFVVSVIVFGTISISDAVKEATGIERKDD